MFSRNYYSLVSGFREYALDSESKNFDIEEILAEVGETLSSRDMKCVRLLYAYYDCENIVGLRNGSTSHNVLGRLNGEELSEEMKSPSHLGGRVAEVLRAYANPEGDEAETVDVSRPFARTLFEAYYGDCADSSSRFLREWSEFDRNLRNILAAVTARGKSLPVESVVVGDGDVAEQLKRSSSSDFGLRNELPYVEAAITAMTDEHNIVERERKLDLIRWDMASELSVFDYYDVNAVLAYLVKANMVARWSRLDRKFGREIFERLRGELDGRELINKS